MRPSARRAELKRSRIVFAEGEDERVLRAVQIIVEEKIAHPVLVGRPRVLESRIKKFGVSLRLGEDCTIVNPEHDERHRDDRRQVRRRYGQLGMATSHR